MKKIYVTVVIYNMECTKSQTLACLERIRSTLPFHIEILLVDNSTQKNSNREFCSNNSIEYLSMDGNYGLSKAYNSAISHIKKLCDEFVVCIFDDDTILSEDYFLKLSNRIAANPKKTIFLPMIYDVKGLLSPSIITNYNVKRAKNIDLVTQENITAINTGMAITSDIFSLVKYNESMFLDYIDHEFIIDCKKENVNFIILQTSLQQNFSDNEKSTVNAAFVRYKIFIRDFKIFCKKKSIYCFVKSFMRAIKLTLRYKNFKFMMKLLRIN